MTRPGEWLIGCITRAVRRYLVGREQKWVFEQPRVGWFPQPVEKTSLYLHVPFCRHLCPYCPYTKVPYQESLMEPYTRAALREVDGWAETIGPTEITSIYIGGGTPTLALESVDIILKHIQEHFHLTGDICIETNPADVNEEMVKHLHDMDVTLVSLGVQSFQSENLALIGRDYNPTDAQRALSLLAKSGFASINVDIMFTLPQQTVANVLADMELAADLGADQITTYPLFTFPYTSVGKYLHLNAIRMPNLKARRVQYQAINQWCENNGFERVSVWGFKRGNVPRYSSVTRDGYIGIGPGAGSQMADGFILNTFDLDSWEKALSTGKSAIALRMPFSGEMAGWWWLYWRFYDTRIPMDAINTNLGRDTHKAHRLLQLIQRFGYANKKNGFIELTEPGAFWLHLAQNYFALNYVNTLWTQARLEPWPKSIKI